MEKTSKLAEHGDKINDKRLANYGGWLHQGMKHHHDPDERNYKQYE